MTHHKPFLTVRTQSVWDLSLPVRVAVPEEHIYMFWLRVNKVNPPHRVKPVFTLKMVSSSSCWGVCRVACFHGILKRMASRSIQPSPGYRPLSTCATSQGFRRTRRGVTDMSVTRREQLSSGCLSPAVRDSPPPHTSCRSRLTKHFKAAMTSSFFYRFVPVCYLTFSMWEQEEEDRPENLNTTKQETNRHIPVENQEVGELAPSGPDARTAQETETVRVLRPAHRHRSRRITSTRPDWRPDRRPTTNQRKCVCVEPARGLGWFFHSPRSFPLFPTETQVRPWRHSGDTPYSSEARGHMTRFFYSSVSFHHFTQTI